MHITRDIIRYFIRDAFDALHALILMLKHLLKERFEPLNMP